MILRCYTPTPIRDSKDFVTSQFWKHHTCMSDTNEIICLATLIPAKPFHNYDIVSVHFNHFYYTKICNKLSRDIAMLTYIYLNVDDS